MQTLDGVQAVAYSRIRYTAGGDYKRTERMRDVLTAMLQKIKTKSIGEINNFLDVILPKVYTNIEANDIIALIPDMMNFKVTDSIGWPYETKGITLSAWYGVPVTLEENVTRLHEELFGEENYTPTATVQEISDSIIKKTIKNVLEIFSNFLEFIKRQSTKKTVFLYAYREKYLFLT